MIISKKCPNCGHVASQEMSVLSCPSCNEFYDKAQGALVQPEQLREEHSEPDIRVARLATRKTPGKKFIDSLRADSNYPNFRGLVKLATWFFYLLAVVVALSVLLNFEVAGPMRIGAVLGAVVFAVFITALKEATLMLADLSDAAVHIAKNT